MGDIKGLSVLYFHILWLRAVFAQLTENTAHLGKYSTLDKRNLLLAYRL